jgi:hypothetical protein
LINTKFFLVLAAAAAPCIVSAQTIDPDLPLSATAGCFSVCLSNVNVKGVQGNATITNLHFAPANMTATVQVQCNGSDVAGASQTVNSTVAATTPTAVPYSIAFAPVAGCAYTTVTTLTSSVVAIGRSSRVITSFAADCADQPCGAGGCTLTQGYWKNHADKWPVTSLTLGSRTYTQAELLTILNQPVKGNGLVSLAHQLIAAKLNAANGAPCATVSGIIAKADTMIGALDVPPIGGGLLSTSSVGSLVSALDQYNNGLTEGCAGHCAE